MAELTLVIGNYNLSSWSLRPWLALKMAAVDFDTIRIELEVPHEKSPAVKAAIRAHSPSGRVPVLEHGDVKIHDSLAICEYVSELYPDRQMWPSDRTARALARAVTAEMHSGFGDMRNTMWMNFRASTPLATLPAHVVEDVRRVQEIWRDCMEASGGPFLFGTRFCIADAFYAPVVSRFTTYGVSVDEGGRRYMDTLWALPPMQEWLQHARAEH